MNSGLVSVASFATSASIPAQGAVAVAACQVMQVSRRDSASGGNVHQFLAGHALSTWLTAEKAIAFPTVVAPHLRPRWVLLPSAAMAACIVCSIPMFALDERDGAERFCAYQFRGVPHARHRE